MVPATTTVPQQKQFDVDELFGPDSDSGDEVRGAY